MSGKEYPSVSQFLKEFRVEELNKLGRLLRIRLNSSSRRDAKINKLQDYFQDLQGSGSKGYHDALMQIRQVYTGMVASRGRYAVPTHMQAALDGPPTCGEPNAQQTQTPNQSESRDPRVNAASLSGKSRVTNQQDARQTRSQARSIRPSVSVQVQASNPQEEVSSSKEAVTGARSRNRGGVTQGLGQGNSPIGASGAQTKKVGLGTPSPSAVGAVNSRPPPSQQQQQPPKKVNQGMFECICEEHNRRRIIGPTVYCGDCGIGQHRNCVTPTTNEAKKSKTEHYCERCRVKWADPFSKLYGKHIHMCVIVRGEGTHILKSIKVPRKGKDYGNNYELKIGCLLLGDEVDFRFHWPIQADLRINDNKLQCSRRYGDQKLGLNGRDQAVSAEVFIRSGHENRIYFSQKDARAFCIMLYLVERQSVDDVKKLMAPAEMLPESLERIIQTVAPTDDEVVTVQEVKVKLTDLLTGTRINKPARFKDVKINAAAFIFDLDTFLETNRKQLKWYCPHSLTHSRLNNLQIDSYFEEVLRVLANEKDVEEVEIRSDGQWRIASDGEGKEGSGPHPWQDVLAPNGGSVRKFDQADAIRKQSTIIEESNRHKRQRSTDSLSVNSDDESQEAREEMRQLAAAAEQRKKQRLQQFDNVVDLTLDDSDNDEQGKNANNAAARANGQIPVSKINVIDLS